LRSSDLTDRIVLLGAVSCSSHLSRDRACRLRCTAAAR
jgi:hypothetical protein